MPSSNFQKVPSFEGLRNLDTSVTFNGKFGTFSNFKKNEVFFSKNPSVFQAKPKILTVEEILLFPSHCAAYLLPSAIAKKLNIFFSKIPSIFQKKPNPERFEKFNHFSRIVRQICYL